MNDRRTLRIFFIYLIIFIIMTSLIGGCSRNKDKSSAKKPGTTKPESKTLKVMQREIEMLSKEFEKTFLMQTAPPPKSDQEQQKLKEEKSGGQTKEKEQTGKQGQEQSSQKKPEPDWAKLEKSITDIHDHWNRFQTEALEKGISTRQVEDFSNKLNELTMTLTQKELYPGLLAANDLYEKTASFEELYEPKVSPDFKKIIYFIRKAAYQSLQKEQSPAKMAVQDAQDLWDKSRPKVKDREMASRAEFAIKELHQAIKEQDPNLIKIKYQIAENSLQDVMKSIEKEKQK